MVLQRLLLKILPEIGEGVSDLQQIATKCGVSEASLTDNLRFLSTQGIGTIQGTVVVFKPEDRLLTALLAIRNGMPVEDVAKYLSWRDFESLVAKILIEEGYHVIKNFRVGRIEIDVFACREDLAVAVDCKHWHHRVGSSTMSKLVESQIARCRLALLSRTRRSLGFDLIIPVIVTLQIDIPKIIEGVPIVPIGKFDSFLNEFRGHLSEITSLTD